MLIYNCLNVYIVCKSFRLRLFCVSFAYRLLFSLTNNMLIYICLRAIFAYRFAFRFRFFCVPILFHVNII